LIQAHNNLANITQQIIPIIMVLKDKGILTDAEIKEKLKSLIDASKKNSESVSIQSKDAGTSNADVRSRQPGILRNGGNSTDQGSNKPTPGSNDKDVIQFESIKPK